MITLKIDTKYGDLSKEAAAFIAVTEELEKLKEKGIIEGYSDVQVFVNSNGGEVYGSTEGK